MLTCIVGCNKGDMSVSPSTTTDSKQSAVQPIERVALSESDQIFEAAILYLLNIKPWSEYWGDTTTKRFLSIDGNDPSSKLQDRVSRYKPSLEPGSKCDSTFEGVFEKESKKPAFLYSIHVLSRSSLKKKFVYFSLKSVGWGGISGTMTVEKSGGTWKVTSVSDVGKG
jgi:hypothetical protein